MSIPDPEFGVGGTMIWYYYICRRQVWLISHKLTPDDEDTNIQIGRLIDQTAYAREKKELVVGNSKMDIYRQTDDGLVVAEVKKSSHYRYSARMQLCFYLKELLKRGITATGELRFPKEKTMERVSLNETTLQELEQTELAIHEIVAQPLPPPALKVRLCAHCAYAEFCWS